MSSAPATTVNGLTFLPVPTFTDVQMAFGAEADQYFDRRELPKVPRKYVDEANRLLFSGGNLPSMGDDVDKAAAKRALHAWLSSFHPSHESKEATVAYALWVWSTESAEARRKQAATA